MSVAGGYQAAKILLLLETILWWFEQCKEFCRYLRSHCKVPLYRADVRTIFALGNPKADLRNRCVQRNIARTASHQDARA